MYRSILFSAFASMALATDLLTFPDLLKSTPSLSNSSNILQLFPEYVGLYSSVRNFTCFVPNDEAFAGVPGDITTPSNMSTPNTLGLFCALGTYTADQISPDGVFLHTFLNSTDFPTGTVIQEGGAVLEARQEGNQTFLISGLNAAELSLKQNPNSEFPNKYPGPRQKSAIVDANVPFLGGLLHIIDTLVTPPLASLSESAAYLDLEAITVANQSGALEQFDSLPSFTIFIANNASYDNFASTVLPKLSAAQVQNVSNYGILDGVIAYADHFTPEGNSYLTRTGETVTLKQSSTGVLSVNGIEVDVDDYLFPNGVVHTLTGVLYPPSLQLPPSS